MYTTKYQLIFLGKYSAEVKSSITTILRSKVADLGLNKDCIAVLDEKNFSTKFQANAPTATVYFGDPNGDFVHLDFLDTVISHAKFILPVVPDLKSATSSLPDQLKPINAFELKEFKNEALVGCALEALGLLRISRRLFISYRRSESRSVAVQLFEKLEERGFDVFLDTHSIKAGDVFQDELWHRMVDTDLVVLLNTPGFLTSKWTKEELAKASGMSIGILQLVWPGHNPDTASELTLFSQLSKSDFEKGDSMSLSAQLDTSSVDKIIDQVESLRARSLASRQDNLIAEFISSSKDLGKHANLQPEKFITLEDVDGKELIYIPTVGVPHAFTYHQTEELIKRIRANKTSEVYLLYDQRNIREQWLKHLQWLDAYLPLKSISITEIRNHLKTVIA